jgi:hypothetical protein
MAFLDFMFLTFGNWSMNHIYLNQLPFLKIKENAIWIIPGN